MGRDILHKSTCLTDPYNLAVSTLEGWGIHNFSGQHFPVPPIFTGDNFFWICTLSLHTFRLKLLSLVLSLYSLIKSPSPPLILVPFRYWEAAMKSPQSLLFTRLNNPNSQPFSIGEVLYPSEHSHGLLWAHSNQFHVLLTLAAPEIGSRMDHCWGPPLDLRQQLHVLLVLGTPELDTVLQMRSSSDPWASRYMVCSLTSELPNILRHQAPGSLFCSMTYFKRHSLLSSLDH